MRVFPRIRFPLQPQGMSGLPGERLMIEVLETAGPVRRRFRNRRNGMLALGRAVEVPVMPTRLHGGTHGRKFALAYFLSGFPGSPRPGTPEFRPRGAQGELHRTANGTHREGSVHDLSAGPVTHCSWVLGSFRVQHARSACCTRSDPAGPHGLASCRFGRPLTAARSPSALPSRPR